MVSGFKIDDKGFSLDHTPQKTFEERLKGVFMKESVKDIMKKIQLLESEGKFEEAKKLRKKLTKING